MSGAVFSHPFVFFVLFFKLSPISLSTDITEETCQRCAARSTTFDHDFCLTSLESAPVGPATTLQGLGVISAVNALNHTTSTISTIERLLSSKAFDSYGSQCLEDCLELYSDGFDSLVEALRAFLEGRYGTANVMASAAMEASSTCEGGFEDRDGESSPLSRENHSMFQLCAVFLCIMNSLSSAPAS